MAITKALFKSEALRGFPASETISRVNKLLCQDNHMCMFVTMFTLLLDTETGEIEWSNAGHNPPLLCASDGSIGYIQSSEGMGIGVLEDSHCVSRKMILARRSYFSLCGRRDRSYERS
jgi:sigma-B regulation protein RsbU (phosphoserine phosphatase)